MRYRLVVVRNAEREIREASRWWDENRLSAPDLFRKEITRGFELITSQPTIGPLAAGTSMPGVRRVLLGRIRYFLYYRVTLDNEAVEVLGLWHTSRGTPPHV